MSVLPKAAATTLTISSFERALVDDAASCDLRRLTFIDAYGLVGTACVVGAAVGESRRPVFHPPESARMAQHLSTMGLTDFLSPLGLVEPSQPPQADRGDVIVPLMSAADAGAQEKVSHLLWRQLDAMPILRSSA